MRGNTPSARGLASKLSNRPEGLAVTRRTISLRIDPALIASLLRLDPSMRIVGARTENELLVFAVDAPNAPDGATEMEPTYARDDLPDPIRLAWVDWVLRTGDRARQTFSPPMSVPDGTQRGRPYELDDPA